MKKFTLGGGEKVKSGVFHTQKKMPKCVSGHLESFKTHLFLFEKKGVPLFFAILADDNFSIDNFTFDKLSMHRKINIHLVKPINMMWNTHLIVSRFTISEK